MRPIAAFIFPNLKSLSISLQELLDPEDTTGIKHAVQTASSLWGQPRLVPIEHRAQLADIEQLAAIAGVKLAQAAARNWSI